MSALFPFWSALEMAMHIQISYLLSLMQHEKN